MASIMTIRDKEGNIIDIPVLQGPAGPIGPEGPEGPKGDTGIYVGTGDMPEGYDIQIDTNGEPIPMIPTPTDEDIGKILVVNEDKEFIFGADNSSITADKVTEGTFAGQVNMNTTAAANLETPQMRDIVILSTDPGDGAEVNYPIGTVIYVV